jgi:hypothetical protein
MPGVNRILETGLRDDTVIAEVFFEGKEQGFLIANSSLEVASRWATSGDMFGGLLR